MGNIIDYVIEYGDKTLEELPFNEVDSLVLSQFSYLKFDKLFEYINMVDAQWEIQFSAITCIFENGFIYIAYRGTDETLTGWKEDFNMAFITPVPAQTKAVQYLNRVALGVRGDLTMLDMYCYIQIAFDKRCRFICMFIDIVSAILII